MPAITITLKTLYDYVAADLEENKFIATSSQLQFCLNSEEWAMQMGIEEYYNLAGKYNNLEDRLRTFLYDTSVDDVEREEFVFAKTVKLFLNSAT